MRRTSRAESSKPKPAEGLRLIPSVEKILTSADFGAVIELFGREAVKAEIAARLTTVRSEGAVKPFSLEALAATVGERLQAVSAPTFQPVINATGILIHTNLGRSPIDPELWKEGGNLVINYSTLEFDLASGARGSRDLHISPIASRLFGCEAALLTNNNAAAILLLLAATAEGKKVIVSRGELVEIGGSFRIPDVIKQGGAELKEVGTTNRTRARDYDDAYSRKTAAILRVNRSNFEIVGFTESPSVEELVKVKRKRRIPFYFDEGSGRVIDLARYGFASKEIIAELFAAGVDAVTCSTDKLIGSTQGGLILGSKATIERCAKHPLMRAVRAGKESYSVIAATLAAFLHGKHETQIPIYRMLATPLEEIRRRAEQIASRTGTSVVVTRSALGGGTTPTESIDSVGLLIAGNASKIQKRMLANDPPIVGTIRENQYILDLRTVFPEQDAGVEEAIAGGGDARGSDASRRL